MKKTVDKDLIAEQEKLENSLKDELLKDSSEQKFSEAYDKIHKFFLEKENVENLYSDKLGWIDNFFLNRCGKGNKILEIGSGNGKLSFAMAEKNNHVIGLDVSNIAISIAQEKLKKSGKHLQVEFKPGDARKLPFNDNTFDFIISQDLVEHITVNDFKIHLSEVYRVLKPGGKYFFWTPSALKGGSSHGLHLKEYNVSELDAILRNTKFTYTWYDLRFYKLKLVVKVSQSLIKPVLLYERALQKIIKFIPKPVDKVFIPPLLFQLKK